LPQRNGSAKPALQWIAGALLVLNLVAGYFAWRPPGGSAEELEQEALSMRAQVIQKRIMLERTRQNVAKVETGRTQGDSFLQNYFVNDRTKSSVIVGELIEAAKEAKIKSKEHSFTLEPIEGSTNLAMMTISGNYEGTYADLIQFVNRLDKSNRLIIIESLNATPQQGTAGILNVNLKLDAFVRQDQAVQQ
jgi:Tfp pilus assembly protein PilO